MAWIETVAQHAAQGELFELYDEVRDVETGRVDHIMAIHSLHPAGLRAHFGLYRAVMAGTPGLRRVDRELIAFIVSRLNGCEY